jgi:hypothetical protein
MADIALSLIDAVACRPEVVNAGTDPDPQIG